MSQSNENKVVEEVVESTLTKSNLLSKVVEHKNMLYLSLGLIGCITIYKNRDMLKKKYNDLFKKKDN